MVCCFITVIPSYINHATWPLMSFVSPSLYSSRRQSTHNSHAQLPLWPDLKQLSFHKTKLITLPAILIFPACFLSTVANYTIPSSYHFTDQNIKTQNQQSWDHLIYWVYWVAIQFLNSLFASKSLLSYYVGFPLLSLL